MKVISVSICLPIEQSILESNNGLVNGSTSDYSRIQCNEVDDLFLNRPVPFLFWKRTHENIDRFLKRPFSDLLIIEPLKLRSI